MNILSNGDTMVRQKRTRLPTGTFWPVTPAYTFTGATCMGVAAHNIPNLARTPELQAWHKTTVLKLTQDTSSSFRICLIRLGSAGNKEQEAHGPWLSAWEPTWPLAKSSRSCTCALRLPQGVKIVLIFAPRAAVSEIRADFQNCHTWAWNLAISQSTRSCTYDKIRQNCI